MFTRLYTKAQARIVTRKDEEGQGTLEYIGMIALAGLLIVALIGVFNGQITQLGQKVTDVFTAIINIKAP